jgi:hypothetical protein
MEKPIRIGAACAWTFAATAADSANDVFTKLLRVTGSGFVVVMLSLLFLFCSMRRF